MPSTNSSSGTSAANYSVITPVPKPMKAPAVVMECPGCRVCRTIMRGTWDWNLVKIETDAGIHGIGEVY